MSMDQFVCLSTHGGAGYATGSYWDGDAIICGLCGTRIESPIPTGYDANDVAQYGPAGPRPSPTPESQT